MILAMVDMGIGNLQSVQQAFRRIGADLLVTTSADDVARADAVILPGVGAFGDGIGSLRQAGLVEPLRDAALVARKPFFGICLGMQLMVDESEEHGTHTGLALIRGRVVRLRPAGAGCRIPNMGWSDVTAVKPGRLFGDMAAPQAFYFAHSYHVECGDSADVAATLDYGGPLTAAIEHHNIFGVQFHPEKSQDAGLDVLATFHREVGEWFARV